MMRGALILAALAGPAAADPDRATLLLGSHHVAAAVPFEAVNPGVILTWDRDPLDWSIGAWRNSYGRLSAAVLAELPLVEGDLSVGLVGGLALYPQDGRHFAAHLGDVVPLAGLHIQADALSILIMPSDGKATDGVIAVGITFDF